MMAGVGIGLIDQNLKNIEVHLQTGLPSEYVKADRKELINVLSGFYDITLTIGNRPEKRLVFEIKADHIGVMEQPQGTLLSAVYDRNGTPIREKIHILSENTLIYDIGFGTEDTFAILAGANLGEPGTHRTYSDTAMRAVFDATLKRLSDEFMVDCKIFEFQKYLISGQIPRLNRSTRTVDMIDFGKILEEENQKLNKKSIDRLFEDYDDLVVYKNLVVTGGTGESRISYIRDMLSGISTLNVIDGNETAPELPFVFSNVRGYYMGIYLKLSVQK